MCDVKRCRQDMSVKVLGVELCDPDYEKHCNGVELDTHKGLLTFCSGAVILKG